MYLGTILGIFCTFFRSTISRFLCFNFLLKRYKPFVVSNRSDVNAPELLLVTITSLFLEKFRRETWNKLQLLVIKKIQIFSSEIIKFCVFSFILLEISLENGLRCIYHSREHVFEWTKYLLNFMKYYIYFKKKHVFETQVVLFFIECETI